MLRILPRLHRRLISTNVPFTSDRYSIQRDSKFSKLEPEDISYFQSILPSNGVVLEKDDLEPFNTDWLKKYRGQSSVALKPKTTEQVSKILSHCHKRSLAVVPQGGNTGLVGGGVPIFDEVVISMANMNQVESFDPISGILICQAGCVLEKIDHFLAEKGYLFPLDLGAKGSCHIGGNISTNAGGIRLLRFGSLHGSVLGLEVVLPDGTIVNSLSTLRKDNTGYDIKQLFIGAEGTLGIVTKASVLTPKRPKIVNAAILGFSTYEKVLQAFKITRSSAAEILSAFEFFDRGSLDLTIKHLNCRDPLTSNLPFYVLIETSGSNKDHDEEKLNTLLEELITQNIASDGTVAQDASQINAFWKIREGITESLTKSGAVYKYDLSIPVPKFYEIVEVMRERLKGQAREVVGYGHLGDGNLHLNITTSKFDQNVLNQIEPFVYEWTAKYKGSISAEHGLGLMKAPYLSYSKSKEEIQIMKNLKSMFDPKGIMNPYKYLPRN